MFSGRLGICLKRDPLCHAALKFEVNADEDDTLRGQLSWPTFCLVCSEQILE